MSRGRSALSERQEKMATTAAVLPVQNSWVTPGRTPNKWEQPEANCTALPGSAGTSEGLKIYKFEHSLCTRSKKIKIIEHINFHYLCKEKFNRVKTEFHPFIHVYTLSTKKETRIHDGQKESVNCY
jgi:hypothetical protein